LRPERRSAVHADPARIRPRPSWRFLGISIRQQVTFGSRAEKEFFFPMTEAGMCMKTNKTAMICRPKMTTFLQNLADCSDISYQPPRNLRESTPLFVTNRALGNAIMVSAYRISRDGVYWLRILCRCLPRDTPRCQRASTPKSGKGTVGQPQVTTPRR